MHVIHYNIRQIRLINNLTQEYVATEIGVSKEWYNKMENGNAKLNLDHLFDIAKVLNVKPELFFTFNSIQLLADKTQEIGLVTANQHVTVDKEVFLRLITAIERLNQAR